MTPELAEASQSLSPGELIELFILDLFPINVPTVFYFTPTNQPGYAVTFDGNDYAYAPIAITGIERSISGDPPNPKVLLPNAEGFTTALVVQYDDLVGAQITRMRTYKHFLDGEALADPSAVLSRDLYTIEQKNHMGSTHGEFSLRPLYALDNRYLPGRVCLRDICTHRYRLEGVDYSKATCPYDGTNYFTEEGVSTLDPALDVCGKSLNDCTIRFGETAELPYRGFPGMSRLRVD